MARFRVSHIVKDYYDVEAEDLAQAIRMAQDSHIVMSGRLPGVHWASALRQNVWDGWDLTPAKKEEHGK